LNRIARQVALAGLALALTAARLAPQENPCLTRTLAVNVINSEDESIKGLTATSFRGKFEGHDVEIISAATETSAHRIVFLVDTSAAMFRDEARRRSEVVMAEGLVSWLPAQTSVALLTFSNPTEMKIDFSQGRKAVNTELAGLELAPKTEPAVPPKTPLADALLEGIAMLAPPRVGDAICMISDGDNGTSQTWMDEVEQKLLAAGIRLFALLPDSALAASTASSANASGAKMLRQIVESTGGDYFIFTSSPSPSADSAARAPVSLTDKDREAIVVASRSLAQEMDEFYNVQIKLQEPADKLSDWTLELVNVPGGKESHPRVIYPPRLAKCP
jgi:Mg-chelatase subunit ChlD